MHLYIATDSVHSTLIMHCNTVSTTCLFSSEIVNSHLLPGFYLLGEAGVEAESFLEGKASPRPPPKNKRFSQWQRVTKYNIIII